MISIERLSETIFKLVPSGKIGRENFHQLAMQIDPLIQAGSKPRLLVDATDFKGWDSLSAFERHIRFVKEHQKQVERIAIVAGHDWQRWVMSAVKMFVHPEVRIYDKFNEAEGRKWLMSEPRS